MGMTASEFLIIAKGLRVAYQNASFMPDDDAFKIWYRLLKDLSYADCALAAERYMQSNHFPPTPADIRELAVKHRRTEEDEQDWGRGWDRVLSAIRRFGYMREQEALESLDTTTRETVKRLGYQNLCRSENQEVDRANFRTIYTQLWQRFHEEDALSEPVRKAIEARRAERALLGTNAENLIGKAKKEG